MHRTPAGASSSNGDGLEGGGSAGSEFTRAGLARFRSAPATWLDALLEEDEDVDAVKPTLTQLLTANSLTSPLTRNTVPFSTSSDPNLFQPSGFHRQNSSPADFVGTTGVGSDGYFSSYGASSDYDYLSPTIDLSPGSKRAREVDSQYSGEFSSQLKGEQGGHAPGTELSDMDKTLEDSVQCKVRAKRGCATHPRSIAERVRRTRISDRIRKLQELVPNMDKQTNTADMLEEAVEYVKTLQKQIQELTEHQRKCKCAAKE